METAKYPYKPKPIVAFAATVFFAGCAAVLGNLALTNDRGILFYRIIEFSPSAATVFFWILTSFSLFAVAGGIFMLVKSFSATRFVLLTQDSLVSPKAGFSENNITIPYDTIDQLTISEVQKQKFLMVHYSGKKISIPKSLLPKKETFEELCSKLAKNIEDR